MLAVRSAPPREGMAALRKASRSPSQASPIPDATTSTPTGAPVSITARAWLTRRDRSTATATAGSSPLLHTRSAPPVRFRPTASPLASEE